ncbi:hypothetical protein [Streptosporangium sp. NPDC000509]|uniref:hypothetical protein n=1 Tax=Streptosporangium sp. NPDC000509 TaxID=3366186 RepID=UPI0036B7BF14
MHRAQVGSLHTVAAIRHTTLGPVRLRIDILATRPEERHPLKEPDRLRFGIEDADGGVDVLAELDGRYPSTEVAGGFTGRVTGLYAAAGTVRCDWFDDESLDEDARRRSSETRRVVLVP